MVQDFLSKEFIESLTAKGIHPKQFLIRLCKLAQFSVEMSGNLNYEEVFNNTTVIDIPMDLGYSPVIEAELAKRVNVSRHTLEEWRQRGLLSDTYYEAKRGRFYFYYPALRAIKLILTDSKRSELISDNIFNNVY